MNNSQQIVGAEDGGRGVAASAHAATLWTQTGGTWGVSTLPAIAARAYGGASGIATTASSPAGPTP